MIKHNVKKEGIQVIDDGVWSVCGMSLHSYTYYYIYKGIKYRLYSNFTLSDKAVGGIPSGKALLEETKRKLKGIDYIYSETAYFQNLFNRENGVVSIWVPEDWYPKEEQ